MRAGVLYLVAMAGLLFIGCSKSEKSDSTASTNTSASGNPVTAPVDYLGAVAKAKKAADKTISTAGLNQAIQSFQAQEGRLPASLNELVTKKYLPSIPPPPAGMKYDYNPQTGTLRLVPGP
jgi:hypothetical protein